MNTYQLHKGYSLIFWGTLFSILNINLQLGDIPLSTEPLIYILAAAGANIMQKEIKNKHLVSVEAGAWVALVWYVLSAPMKMYLTGGLGFDIFALAVRQILLIWMFTQVFAATGDLLPAYWEKMQKISNIYGILTAAITLVVMAATLWGNYAIAGAVQLVVQLWIIIQIGECNRAFPKETLPRT